MYSIMLNTDNLGLRRVFYLHHGNERKYIRYSPKKHPMSITENAHVARNA